MPELPEKAISGSLRFGVMCNGTVFQRWQADAVEDLRKHGHEVTLLIQDPRQSLPLRAFAVKKGYLNKIFCRNWRVFLFTFLENRVFKPDARRPVDLSNILAGIPVLECTVEKKGFSEYFTPVDVASIRNRDLDFILRFGFNIVRGDILEAARFGIWSFHHDDEEKYRGGPAGFWEIHRGDPVSGAILQRLTSRLDGGVILKKGYLKTVRHSYRGNLEQLLSVSAAWPAMVADLLAGNPASDFGASRTEAQVFRLPGNLTMLLFLIRLLVNKVRYNFADLFRAEDWAVGLTENPIDKVALGKSGLADKDISWFPHTNRGRYLADPAGFMADGRLHILAEDYSHAEGKAVIGELDPDGVIHPDGVISGATHFSYPGVVEYKGDIYCLPEAWQSNRITLFRRNPADGTFTPWKVLLGNIEAVDPTLFYHDGCWWLFFTERKNSNTHLYLWFSKDFDGPYEPHPANPVKTDIRSARPAGTPFVHEGSLYRPAQDCSVTYGGRVVINKVTRLSPAEFMEEVAGYVESPPGSRYNRGLHTISGVGSVTIIDGKRFRFNRIHMLNRIWEKFCL